MHFINGYKYTPIYQNFQIRSSQYSEYLVLLKDQDETNERRLKEDTSKMQKAWFYNEYGSINVLQSGELPVPKPGPGQILVKIRAAALNPADFKRREGIFKSADSDFPVFIFFCFFLTEATSPIIDVSYMSL
jgi:hypothetical protein